VLRWCSAWAQRGETVKIGCVSTPCLACSAPVGVKPDEDATSSLPRKFSGNATLPGSSSRSSRSDNKLSPAESLNALKSAMDQGVRYIIQGNGSSVALALVDAVDKHNERNPGKEVIFLNDSAVDPDLTNSKCSYWHFRFDADTSMKMEAMTDASSRT
jgi:branched-chain amino acid transport system substrate-binding protein